MVERRNGAAVARYVSGCIDGTIVANEDRVLACKRYLADIEGGAYDFLPQRADLVIGIIEKTFVHVKGDDFVGKPFLLEPWEKFIVYNLAGFYIKGTDERRFKEAFIFIPRKNGKTPFAAALAWALSILDRGGNPTLYLVGNIIKQALESFLTIKRNIKLMGEESLFRIRDSQNEHSIFREFSDGSITIEAVANEPNRDNLDGKNAPLAIADEIHNYSNPNQYFAVKQMTKAYRNKLVIGITTAGRRRNCFCASRLAYCKKVLHGLAKDEQYFIFICMADNPADYTNPVEHEKANPNYGVTIRPVDIMAEATQAQNDPESRDQFLNKSLNIFTNQLNTYFDVGAVEASDAEHSFTLEQLVKLPIFWYGGADLSKLHDLTAAALVGEYNGVLIAITHGFMPLAMAYKKADEDEIPFFWWKDEGQLTLSNSEVVEFDDVAKWFIQMRGMGFRIKNIGYDRKLAREFVGVMQHHRFKMVDQDQKYWKKTEAFRHIERNILQKTFTYLGSPAFAYCISNVKAIEDSEDRIKFMKVGEHDRIDLFDATVIACLRMIEDRDGDKAKSSYLKGH